MKIAVIGTGAVGGYYGALLQQSGADVHFLLHRDYAHVREHGLRVDSPRGDIHLPMVAAYGQSGDMPKCDLVIVALKTTANAALPGILPDVLADDGVVLTLQNGLGSDRFIAGIVGSERVLGGLCFLCANKDAPGVIRHLDYGLITLGAYRADGVPGGITARLEQIGALLSEAGMEIQLIADLQAARWRKLVWNVPFNGLSVVHNCLTDVLVQNPATRALCRRLMEEVAAASAVCAHPIEDAFLDMMMDHTDRMEPYAPSMKLDYDAGRLMELEAIYGTPLAMAAAAGVPMPGTAVLFDRLRLLEQSGRAITG
jgi:2-dehydropantoate 2-reductase